MATPDRATWKLAATGEISDVITWKPAFKVIGEVHSLLSDLEELGEENVDWDLLLAGLPRFADLRHLFFPPLYDETEFDSIDGFLTLTKEPSGAEAPRMSFNSIRIYIDREQEDAIIRDFQQLRDRLGNYAPLKQLWE